MSREPSQQSSAVPLMMLSANDPAPSVIKSASSVLSLMVLEHMAGDELTKQIISNRRATCLGVAMMNSNDNSQNSADNNIKNQNKAKSSSTIASSQAIDLTGLSNVRESNSSKKTMTSRKSLLKMSTALSDLMNRAITDSFKATATLITIVILLTICGLPLVIVRIVNFGFSLSCRDCQVPPNVANGVTFLSYLFSTLNPFVYFVFSSPLRRALIRHCASPFKKVRSVVFRLSLTSNTL